MRGFLDVKCTSVGKKDFKRRYFIVDTERMSLCSGKTAELADGPSPNMIPFANITKVKWTGECSFDIVTFSRSYTFVAESEAAAQTWTHNIWLQTTLGSKICNVAEEGIKAGSEHQTLVAVIVLTICASVGALLAKVPPVIVFPMCGLIFGTCGMFHLWIEGLSYAKVLEAPANLTSFPTWFSLARQSTKSRKSAKSAKSGKSGKSSKSSRSTKTKLENRHTGGKSESATSRKTKHSNPHQMHNPPPETASLELDRQSKKKSLRALRQAGRWSGSVPAIGVAPAPQQFSLPEELLDTRAGRRPQTAVELPAHEQSTIRRRSAPQTTQRKPFSSLMQSRRELVETVLSRPAPKLSIIPQARSFDNEKLPSKKRIPPPLPPRRAQSAVERTQDKLFARPKSSSSGEWHIGSPNPSSLTTQSGYGIDFRSAGRKVKSPPPPPPRRRLHDEALRRSQRVDSRILHKIRQKQRELGPQKD